MAIPETVGERIKARVQELGKTLDWLAATVGVTPQQMSRLVNGKSAIRETRLEQIATALETTPAALRYGETEYAPSDGRRMVVRETVRDLVRLREGDQEWPVPDRVMRRVRKHLEELRGAGAGEPQVEEAERLMLQGAYNKINASAPRHRSAEDVLMDVEAAWDFIVTVADRQGLRIRKPE